MIKVGIIGAGYMGKTHGTVISKEKNVKVTGVADIKKERAEELACMLGARVYSDIDKLIDSGIDAIFVTTPNTMHLEPVIKALERDIHVFSEKPMATNLKDAKKILKASEKSQAIYQLGFNRRFAPVYKYMKSLILDKQFKPFSAHIKMNRGELKNPDWVGDPKITGGFLYETTIHLFDMVRWLIGEVTEVICYATSNFYEGLDNFIILLSFKNDLYATFASCAHTSWVFPFERIELYGDHSSIISEEMDRVIHSRGLDSEIVYKDFFHFKITQKWGYEEEDKIFLKIITEGGIPPITAKDGYKSVEIAEACYRSAVLNDKVKLPIKI